MLRSRSPWRRRGGAGAGLRAGSLRLLGPSGRARPRARVRIWAARPAEEAAPPGPLQPDAGLALWLAGPPVAGERPFVARAARQPAGISLQTQPLFVLTPSDCPVFSPGQICSPGPDLPC